MIQGCAFPLQHCKIQEQKVEFVKNKRVSTATGTILFFIEVFGLCICSPEGLSLVWGGRELKSILQINLKKGSGCGLIAGTKENNDDLLLGWSLNGMQFAICRFFAGIYVLKTRFENSRVFHV